MTLITVNEIREKLNSGVKIEDLGIQFEKYLPFIDKKYIINQIVLRSIVNEDNLFRIDFALKDLLIEFALIQNFSSIDITDVADYDELKALGIIDYCLEMINCKEIEAIKAAINNELNQINLIGLSEIPQKNEADYIAI